MLTNISWGTYGIAVILLITGWYLFVGIRFYYTDVKDILSGKRTFRIGSQRPLTQEESHSPQPEAEHITTEIGTSAFAVEDPTFNDVDTLIEQLKAAIADASGRQVVKEEFLTYLQFVLSEFPTVKNSPFRASVSEFIASECNVTGAITISQGEAEGLWG